MQTEVRSTRLTQEQKKKHDIRSHDRLIYKLINSKLRNFNSSDICLERDDLLQMGRMIVLRALDDYDPTRGQSLSSYIHMVLDSRFGNLRSRFMRKNAKGTVSMTEVLDWSVEGSADRDTPEEHTDKISMAGQGYINTSTNEASICERMDAQRVYEKLDEVKKLLFKEFYIEGFSILEIRDRNPHLKYHRIARELSNIEKICKTLCGGLYV